MNSEKYEQPDLPKFNEEGNSEAEKTEEQKTIKKIERVVHKPHDELSFDCEKCGDRLGGCPTCGWGKNMD